MVEGKEAEAQDGREELDSLKKNQNVLLARRDIGYRAGQKLFMG